MTKKSTKRESPRDKAMHLVSLGSWLEAQGIAAKQGAAIDWEKVAERLNAQLTKASPEGSSWAVTFTPAPDEKAGAKVKEE